MSNDRIEIKIHNILLDIDPTNHDYEEQSVIVAEATAAYAQKKAVRKASKDDSRMEEAEIIDCILQAMSDSSNDLRYACAEYTCNNDGEIDYEDVLKSLRFSSKDFGDMNIINENDIDIFFPEDKKGSNFAIEDVCDEVHDSSLYEVSGHGKHRSDSINRGD